MHLRILCTDLFTEVVDDNCCNFQNRSSKRNWFGNRLSYELEFAESSFLSQASAKFANALEYDSKSC